MKTGSPGDNGVKPDKSASADKAEKTKFVKALATDRSSFAIWMCLYALSIILFSEVHRFYFGLICGTIPLGLFLSAYLIRRKCAIRGRDEAQAGASSAEKNDE